MRLKAMNKLWFTLLMEQGEEERDWGLDLVSP